MAPDDELTDPDEIEITEEMIEAGASVLFGFQTLTRFEWSWAEEVFRAMWEAHRRSAD